MKKPVNANIDLLVKAKGKSRLTLREIEDATGIHKSQFSNLCSGRWPFSIKICKRLAATGIAPLETILINQAKYLAELHADDLPDDVEPIFGKVKK